MYISLYCVQESISAFILICTSIEAHLMHFEKTESTCVGIGMCSQPIV